MIADSATSSIAEPFTAFIRLRPGTKIPLDDQWQLTKPGTSKPEGNYGIALQPDELVLDFDPRNYPPGRDLLAELWTQYLKAAPTKMVKTPSGGCHLYFRKPPNRLIKKKQSAWPGVDFLTAGCQVAGPGSMTDQGVYEVKADLPIALIPDSFLDTLEQRADEHADRVEAASIDFSLLCEPQFVEKCKVHQPAVQGQHGDAATYQLACKGRDLGLPKEATYAAMRDYWNPRCEPPWSEDDLWSKVMHAYRYAKNAFGCESVETKFTPSMAPSLDETRKALAEAERSKRWSEFQPPEGFRNGMNGLEHQVLRNKVLTWERVSGPVIVTARMRGLTDDDALGGLMLELFTIDGIRREVPLSRALLYDKQALAKELAGINFSVVPGKELVLQQFLEACRPENELIAVNQTGWVEHDDRLAFVFPDGSTDPKYRYRPKHMSSLRGVVRQSGDHEDWLRNVFDPARSISLAVYEVLKSLSVPLYRFCSAMRGHDNLHSETSRGKTTMLQIAASIWGRGTDPDQDPKSYICKLHATGNAIETLLVQFNDLPTFLDELGTFSGDLGLLAYTSASGRGKERLNQQSERRELRSWQTSITSTGEVSIVQKIEEREKTAMGGQAARWINRRLPADLFASAAQVDAIKAACSRYYGTLGPLFINKIIASYSGTGLRVKIQKLLDQSTARLMLSRPNFDNAQRRVLQRFAMVEVAGALLVEFGLVPSLTEDEVKRAVDNAVTAWEPESRQLSDMERALVKLRNFMIEHQDSEFKRPAEAVLDSAGGLARYEPRADKVYRKLSGILDFSSDGDLVHVYVFGSAIKRATSRDAEEVAKELDKRGFLVRTEQAKASNRYQKKTPRLSGSQRPYAYAIKASFLGGADETEPADGDDDWSDLI
jgi:hypothetical protein